MAARAPASSPVLGGSVVVVVEGVVVVVSIYIILTVVVELKGGDPLSVAVTRYLIYCKEIIFQIISHWKNFLKKIDICFDITAVPYDRPVLDRK